jgi:hypothetical protein
MPVALGGGYLTFVYYRAWSTTHAKMLLRLWFPRVSGRVVCYWTVFVLISIAFVMTTYVSGWYVLSTYDTNGLANVPGANGDRERAKYILACVFFLTLGHGFLQTWFFLRIPTWARRAIFPNTRTNGTNRHAAKNKTLLWPTSAVCVYFCLWFIVQCQMAYTDYAVEVTTAAVLRASRVAGLLISALLVTVARATDVLPTDMQETLLPPSPTHVVSLDEEGETDLFINSNPAAAQPTEIENMTTATPL